MNIQTETAIIPFQGAVQPARSVDYRIMKYSEGEKYLREEPSSMDDDYGQAAVIYGRSGKESAGAPTLGKNIDMYI